MARPYYGPDPAPLPGRPEMPSDVSTRAASRKFTNHFMSGRVRTSMMRSLVSFALIAASLGSASADRGGRRHRWQPQPQPAPLINLDALRQITASCQDAFEGAANEQACVSTVTRGSQRFDASAAIRGCEDAFDGDVNELACLAIAVDAWQDPVPAIRACEDAFDGDANELTCTRTVAQSWLPVAAVPACEAAFDGDANEQTCLNTLVGTRYDVAQLVSYCEDSYDGDANELWCLGQFR